MQVKTYTQTVSIRIRFTPTEEKIIEETRRSDIGQYWQANTIDTNALSLGEIEMLYETLGLCLGHKQPVVNIFKPCSDESPEDIPGNGDLAAPAEALYQNLLDVLLQWNQNVSVHDSGVGSRSPDE